MAYQSMPFSPQGNATTVNMNVTAVSSFMQFDNITPAAGAYYKSGVVRLFNAGPSLVFVELVGGGRTTAAFVNTGFPLAAGAEKYLLTGGATSLAAITAAGSSTLYATPGEGGI